MRLSERGPDATGGTGEQHEAALGLTHDGVLQKRSPFAEPYHITNPDFDRRSCSAPYCRSTRECTAPAVSVQGSCHPSRWRISHKLAKFGAVHAGAHQPRGGAAVVAAGLGRRSLIVACPRSES